MLSSGSDAFDAFRSKLLMDVSLRHELEYALLANVNRVNPSDRANRFGSGAAVEWILAAVAYNAGVLSAPGGHNVDGFDLRDLRKKAQGLWSVKNTTNRSNFRLSNGMGGSGKGFVDPVVLLSPALPGIVFADPKVHEALALRQQDTGDAVVLPFAAVLEHASNHPECVAVCSMPQNEGNGQDDPWMDYVNSLLDPVRFPKLSGMFRDAKPTSGSVVQELLRLAALRDAGTITEAQFEDLIKKL